MNAQRTGSGSNDAHSLPSVPAGPGACAGARAARASPRATAADAAPTGPTGRNRVEARDRPSRPPDPTRTRDGCGERPHRCALCAAHKPETRVLSTHARRPIKARSRIPLTSDLSAASPCSVTDGVDLRRYGNLTGNLNPGYASSDQDKGQATDSAMVVFIGERSHAPAPNFANAFAAACSAQPLQRTVYG